MTQDITRNLPLKPPETITGCSEYFIHLHVLQLNITYPRIFGVRMHLLHHQLLGPSTEVPYYT